MRETNTHGSLFVRRNLSGCHGHERQSCSAAQLRSHSPGLPSGGAFAQVHPAGMGAGSSCVRCLRIGMALLYSGLGAPGCTAHRPCSGSRRAILLPSLGWQLRDGMTRAPQAPPTPAGFQKYPAPYCHHRSVSRACLRDATSFSGLSRTVSASGP